jgi:chitodextrinase
VAILALGGVTAVVLTGGFASSTQPVGASDPSHQLVVTPGPTVPATTGGSDTEKPTQPQNLRVIGRSETAITLDWDPSTDNVGVSGYIVFRDGRQVATTYIPGFTDTGLAAGSTHQYTVSAFDAAGNRSDPSAPTPATTLAQPDANPPVAPAQLRVTAIGPTSVSLAWNAAHDDIGVAGYEVLRDGHVVATITDLAYTDTGLTPGTTHTYVVRAFDTTNNLSVPSNRATATTTLVGTPTGPPTGTPTPTAPPVTVTGFTLDASPVQAPACTTTITLTVTANGPVSITVTLTVNGAPDTSKKVTLAANAPQSVVLDTVGVDADGSATVTDDRGDSAKVDLVAPAGCPAPPTTAPAA